MVPNVSSRLGRARTPAAATFIAVQAAILLVLVSCAAPHVPTGTLAVDVLGLPDGVEARITVVAPGGAETAVSSSTELELPAGTYDLVVAPTATLGHWSVDSGSVTVVGEQTTGVTVTYTPVAVATYVDYLDPDGTDALAAALAASDAQHDVLASEAAAVAALTAMAHDAFVISAQGDPPGASLVEALTAAVEAGARVIFTTYVAGEFWSTFGVEGIEPGTGVAAISLAPPLDDELPEAVALVQLGWVTNNLVVHPSPGAVTACTNDGGDSCAVIANDGRTIVLGVLVDVFAEPSEGARLYANALAAVLR